MKTLALSLALTFAVASSAVAADRTDLDIFRDVSMQVARYHYFTIFDSVQADVDDGVVTLTGRVTLPFKAAEIAKRVARVAGVTAVRNELEALPVSQFDDTLRFGIARALYAHPSLAMYGIGSYPSIHVVVEHGRVTLNGVVNNDADRQIAHMVARQFQTFGVTNDLKTRDEAQRELEKL